MIGFLFVPDEAFRIDPADEAKLLDEAGRRSSRRRTTR